MKEMMIYGSNNDNNLVVSRIILRLNVGILWCVPICFAFGRLVCTLSFGSLMELNCYRCIHDSNHSFAWYKWKKKRTYRNRWLQFWFISLSCSLSNFFFRRVCKWILKEKIRWYSNMYTYTLSKANTIDSSIAGFFLFSRCCTFKTVHWTEFAFNLLNSVAAMNSTKETKKTFIEILIVTLLCEWLGLHYCTFVRWENA